MRLDNKQMPREVWVFQLPDGHWEIRFEQPEVPATVYGRVDRASDSSPQKGEARVTVETLLQASMRLRPDRIFLGEIRGAEAYSFLRAINTGHPGSNQQQSPAHCPQPGSPHGHGHRPGPASPRARPAP